MSIFLLTLSSYWRKVLNSEKCSFLVAELSVTPRQDVSYPIPIREERTGGKCSELHFGLASSLFSRPLFHFDLVCIPTPSAATACILSIPPADAAHDFQIGSHAMGNVDTKRGRGGKTVP